MEVFRDRRDSDVAEALASGLPLTQQIIRSATRRPVLDGPAKSVQHLTRTFWRIERSPTTSGKAYRQPARRVNAYGEDPSEGQLPGWHHCGNTGLFQQPPDVAADTFAEAAVTGVPTVHSMANAASAGANRLVSLDITCRSFPDERVRPMSVCPVP